MPERTTTAGATQAPAKAAPSSEGKARMRARLASAAAAVSKREAARAAEVAAEAAPVESDQAELFAARRPAPGAYFVLRTSVLVNPYLRLSDLAVLASLASFCGPTDRDGRRWAYPALRSIAARAVGLTTPRAVQAALARLQRYGLVTKYERGSRYRTNLYRLDV